MVTPNDGDNYFCKSSQSLQNKGGGFIETTKLSYLETTSVL